MVVEGELMNTNTYEIYLKDGTSEIIFGVTAITFKDNIFVFWFRSGGKARYRLNDMKGWKKWLR